jgi:EAL domain-containing protein (putative c-di-GMP-specific phosphodiesterase class I)
MKLGEVLRPILQTQDVVSLLDARHVAVLVRRGRKQELEQAKELIREMLRYRQDTGPDIYKGFSVGMAMLNKGHSSSETWLRQAEEAAEQSSDCMVEASSGYPPPPTPPDRGVKEGTVWLRDAFLLALEKNSIVLHERRYKSLQTGLSAVRTIELIPRMNHPGMGADIYQQAAVYGASADLDQLLCELAIQRLYGYIEKGVAVRLILRQSAAVVEEAGYIERIKSVLRRLHIVGHGLVLEFSLPELATCLRHAIALFDQLTALGITASLSHFPGNELGYKALEHLNVGVVRPRSALLHQEPEKIERMANRVRSRKVEVILPVIDDSERVSPKWFECADCVQEGFSMTVMHGDLHRPSEGLGLPLG